MTGVRRTVLLLVMAISVSVAGCGDQTRQELIPTEQAGDAIEREASDPSENSTPTTDHSGHRPRTELLRIRGQIKSEFPDLYAGAYFSPSGERMLTLVFVDEPPNRVHELLRELNEPVRVRSDAQFTLRELDDKADALLAKLVELAPDMSSGAGVDEVRNGIYLYSEASADVVRAAIEQARVEPRIVFRD